MVELALEALVDFEIPWGDKYPAIVKSRRIDLNYFYLRTIALLFSASDLNTTSVLFASAGD